MDHGVSLCRFLVDVDNVDPWRIQKSMKGVRISFAPIAGSEAGEQLSENNGIDVDLFSLAKKIDDVSVP